MARAAAAPPVVFPPADTPAADASAAYLVTRLSAVSADAMNLREAVAGVVSDAANGAIEDAAYLKSVGSLNEVWSREQQQIGATIGAIEAWLSDPANTTVYAFELTEIQNEWDRVTFIWPTGDDAWPRKGADAIAAPILDRLDRLIEKCAYITLAPRIQQHLRTIRPGRYKDFAQIAAGETVDEEMNKRLLARFASSPLAFDGLFDVERQRIARLDRSFAARIPAFAAILATFLVPLGLTWLAYRSRDDIELARTIFGNNSYGAFLGYASMAFLGFIIHLLLKARTAKNPDGTRMGAAEALDWVALNSASLCWSVLGVWVAVVIARTGLFEIEGQMAALIVGYSADSIVDMFTGKFTTYATTTRDAALEKLKPD